MKYPWLYVGAKVVCVKAPGPLGYGETRPVEGGVYTVRGIRPDGWNGRYFEVGIFLEEIVNAPQIYSTQNGQRLEEKSWRISRFRPVLPDTTKQVEEMKQAMRDHVANASGGMGIRKVRT